MYTLIITTSTVHTTAIRMRNLFFYSFIFFVLSVQRGGVKMKGTFGAWV